eukprot:Skav229150  [mRNA]  locus=scaffold2275:96682:111313:- [translate_table: standard]
MPRLTLASNFAAKELVLAWRRTAGVGAYSFIAHRVDGGSKFSFQPNNAYRNERSTPSLNVAYYVTDDFEEHYGEGTRSLAEFDRQVLAAKRRGSEQDLQAARNMPRPACMVKFRAKEHPFRLDRKGALAYYRGMDDNYPEDTGFALKPWVRYDMENSAVILQEKTAFAMGNYVFEDANGAGSSAAG